LAAAAVMMFSGYGEKSTVLNFQQSPAEVKGEVERR
jgi:hypothetical protein